MASGTRSGKNVMESKDEQTKGKQLLSMLESLLVPAATEETPMERNVEKSNEDLPNLTRDKLIDIIFSLRVENNALKAIQEFRDKMEKRMENLERQQNENFQYLRRDTVVISGIPTKVPQKHLEDEVIRIYDCANVTVHGTKLDKHAIQACHRTGKAQKNVIMKFTNRKYANEGLYNGKNLKVNAPYDTPTYINSSFCPEYGFLNYAVRQAKKAKKKSLL